MLFEILIITLFETIIKSPNRHVVDTLRTDCYVSFSTPTIFMKVEHYYPSGPRYLYTEFYYSNHSAFYDNEIENSYAEYSFKRYDEFCETSIIFTTLGNDFKKLDLLILIYIAKNSHLVTTIQYTFYKGFMPGIYGLRNYNQNFIIHVQVSYYKETYLWIAVNSEEEAGSYLKSITKQNGQLCVITENNNAVILNPDYGSEAPSGLIFGLQAIIFKDGLYLGRVNYPSFECHKDEKYFYKPVIFIIDGKNFEIKFRVIYMKYFQDTPASVTQILEISNSKYEYVYNLKYINRKYNKVFLMRVHFDYEKCPNGYIPMIYVSEDRTRYLVTEKERVKISHFVEFVRTSYLPVADPCLTQK